MSFHRHRFIIALTLMHSLSFNYKLSCGHIYSILRRCVSYAFRASSYSLVVDMPTYAIAKEQFLSLCFLCIQASSQCFSLPKQYAKHSLLPFFQHAFDKTESFMCITSFFLFNREPFFF